MMPSRDDGWRDLPQGSTESKRREILRQRSIAAWEKAYSMWLTVSVALGFGASIPWENGKEVTDAMAWAEQCRNEWKASL